jgi:hypothetical protein
VGARELEELVVGRLLELATDADLLAEVKSAGPPEDGSTVIVVDDMQRALASLSTTWPELSPEEQARIVRLLVERVIYHGTVGEVAIMFRPNGIAALARELGRKSA